jgi:hypothetical protein
MDDPIFLSHFEIGIGFMIGAQRNGSNRMAGVNDRKIGYQNGIDIDVLGACAELAFCKFANVYPDLSISIRKGTCDLELKNGMKVDVKATTYPQGMLLAESTKAGLKNAADIYVLMINLCKTYRIWRIAGWATANDLLKPENLRKMKDNYRPSYALNQSVLRQGAFEYL